MCESARESKSGRIQSAGDALAAYLLSLPADLLAPALPPPFGSTPQVKCGDNGRLDYIGAFSSYTAPEKQVTISQAHGPRGRMLVLSEQVGVESTGRMLVLSANGAHDRAQRAGRGGGVAGLGSLAHVLNMGCSASRSAACGCASVQQGVRRSRGRALMRPRRVDTRG
jgi:hypothetical protein